jgi:hypothetical protein
MKNQEAHRRKGDEQTIAEKPRRCRFYAGLGQSSRNASQDQLPLGMAGLPHARSDS